MPARVHHTPAQKLHLRRHKRKHGPSAVRRRERRAHLQIKVVISADTSQLEAALNEINATISDELK
jgi:hypothetical protein